MSWRKILLLGMILATLRSYVYFYELKHKEAQKKAEEKAKKVFSLETAQVEMFSLKREGQVIACRKEREKWQLNAPLQAPADAETIDDLLFSLTQLDTERVVDENPQDLSFYGLKEPQIEVTLQGKGNGENEGVSQTLLVGQSNPTNSFLYAQRKGDPRIILIALNLSNDLDKSVYDLRDKTVIAFQTEDIQQLELSRNSWAVICQRSSTSQWRLLAPVQYRADKERVQKIMSEAKNLKVKEFIAEEVQDFSPYGLDSPAHRLSFWTKPEKEPTQVLLLSTHKKEGGGIYARRQEGDNVFTIEERFLEVLPASADGLRDPHPFRIKADEKVEKLELRYPEESVLCAKDKEERWQLQEPVQASADQIEVEALLERFQSLEVKKFVADSPADLKAFGLEQPQRQFRIWQQGQVDPQALILGGEALDDKGVYARMKGQQAVFLLSSSQVEGLSKRADDLRDRALLSFNTDEVGKLSIRYPSKGFTLERKEEAWKLTAPVQAKAKYVKVLDLLWEVSGLKYQAIAAEKSSDGRRYGLDKPQLTITLWKANGDDLGALLLGTKIPEKNAVFAKTQSSATIYLIEERFLEKIPKETMEIVEE